MLKVHAKPTIVSANPLASVTLTMRTGGGERKLVEWTSVRNVRWTSNGRRYVRHVLEPILREHVGLYGVELNLLREDVGHRLVVDVPVERLPDEHEFDVHIEYG